MYLKIVGFVIFIFSVCSCNSKDEIPDEGKITERTPEEIASLKTYAPDFEFQSIDGESISLDNFKGKYIYMDIWATWCGPCLQQLPAMKAFEEKYRDENIRFLSISVDSDRDKAKWQEMVKEKGMQGVQLFAGRSAKFQQDYQIRSIPRFLVIGKDGEILEDDPPRPMDYRTGEMNQELIQLFDQLISEKNE